MKKVCIEDCQLGERPVDCVLPVVVPVEPDHAMKCSGSLVPSPSSFFHQTMLKSALLAERKAFMEENPNYRILGSDFVCPVPLIDSICTEARFLQTVADLNRCGLRSELKTGSFIVIMNVLCNCPPASKRKRCV